MEEYIKIGFIGNCRYGLNSEQKDEIISILDKYENIIVSHGDCIGTDTDFHNLCMNYRNEHPNKKIRIEIFPSNDLKYRAFNEPDLLNGQQSNLQQSNFKIIKYSSILIACPIDKNKERLRSGTWRIIREARKQNLIVYIL